MKWVLILFTIMLVGCQGLPLPGVTAIAPITNVGDEAETITKITNGPDIFWQMLCIVGWMAPDPFKIWDGVKGVFRSLGHFILKLFGRSV